MVLEAGGQWQIPIRASKGDFIIWTSSTVHSALLQTKKEYPTKKDKWAGWRGVIYICWRPREEFEDYQLAQKWKAFQNNLVTSHWGTKVFPSGFGRWAQPKLFSKKLQEYIRNPRLIYSLPGMDWRDYLTEEEQIMMGKA